MAPPQRARGLRPLPPPPSGPAQRQWARPHRRQWNRRPPPPPRAPSQSRTRGRLFASSPPSSLPPPPPPPPTFPRSILAPEEMSASQNQAAEASKEFGARKIGPTGNKIRIRLPPRKRLTEGLQTISTGVAMDTKNHPAKEVSEYVDDNTQSTIATDTQVKVEEASSKPPGEGKCEEPNRNNLRETLSRETLPEAFNFIIPSRSPTTTAGMEVEEESTYPVSKSPCEEGRLAPEDSSNTPVKESPCIGATDETPNKNLSITRVQAEVENNNSIVRPCEDSSNNMQSKRLLPYETNSNSPIKDATEEFKINKPSEFQAASAANCEQANDNCAGNGLSEEPRNNTATVKLSPKPIKSAPSRRPADPADEKKYNKKLRTSAAHGTYTSGNTSGMKISTSVGPAVKQSTRVANLEATKEYKEFEEKVKRTVYLDNMTLLATEAIITMALNQFGSVRNVTFLVNYTVPYDIPQSALVEMETEKDAESVVNMLHEFPFMISGMPRPVRAKRATAEMFNDRPQRPGRKLDFRWVGPTDPDCHNVRKFKLMAKRHEVENLVIIKHQLEEEGSLAKQQQNDLNCDYRKLESIDSVILSGWVNRLTRIYNLNFNEVY